MDIPHDVIKVIFDLLDPKSKILMVRVCKAWDLKYKLDIENHEVETVLSCPRFRIELRGVFDAKPPKASLIFEANMAHPGCVVFKNDKAYIWGFKDRYAENYLEETSERFELSYKGKMNLLHKFNSDILECYVNRKHFCTLMPHY